MPGLAPVYLIGLLTRIVRRVSLPKKLTSHGPCPIWDLWDVGKINVFIFHAAHFANFWPLRRELLCDQVHSDLVVIIFKQVAVTIHRDL